MKKMKELKDLEKIGLSEVSKRTHIEVENLLFIINKDFEKLGRVKAIGFIKILEREYKLDLANWREEYEEYYQEHKNEKNDELFIVVKDENKRKKIISKKRNKIKRNKIKSKNSKKLKIAKKSQFQIWKRENGKRC